MSAQPPCSPGFPFRPNGCGHASRFVPGCLVLLGFRGPYRPIRRCQGAPSSTHGTVRRTGNGTGDIETRHRSMLLTIGHRGPIIASPSVGLCGARRAISYPSRRGVIRGVTPTVRHRSGMAAAAVGDHAAGRRRHLPVHAYASRCLPGLDHAAARAADARQRRRLRERVGQPPGESVHELRVHRTQPGGAVGRRDEARYHRACRGASQAGRHADQLRHCRAHHQGPGG